jgi:HD-GYP domain-containing protein (c-di-GMP phosphodiesterase class II)
MTNDRSYSAAMSSEQAREELLRHSGTKFHLGVVNCFVALLDARLFEHPAQSNGNRPASPEDA